jgi:ABC-type Fe3+-hydroxamate transport system substrate-binding protein
VFRHGTGVKKTILLLILVALLPAGCSRHKSGGPGSQTTQTIAPAPGMPAPTGTDAMTQTVEVDDSRSEADGMASSTTTTKAVVKKPPAKKKGKK